MSLTVVGIVVLAILVLNLLVHALLLWGSAKCVRVGGATYRRSLLTTLLIYALFLGLLAGVVWSGFRSVDVVLAPISALVWLALAFAGVRWLLRASLGKALLTTLLWVVCGSIYAGALVFLIKGWVAEAFVVPTGAMAETVLGYHKTVSCPQCGHTSMVNASLEADPQGERPKIVVTGCTCPNCRFEIDLMSGGAKPLLETGDRLLALKLGYGTLARHQLLIFDYPEPVPGGGKLQYVKRLVGLPGETIGLHRGKLYVSSQLTYPENATAAADELRRNMYTDDERALEQLQRDVRLPEADKGRKFTIVRKGPQQILALSRLVYDNDNQAKDLVAAKLPPRWSADDGWKPDNLAEPRVFEAAGKAPVDSWLRYRHLLPNEERTEVKPSLITDFLGYNSWKPNPATPQPNWASDLILECDIQVDGSGDNGKIQLEISKGTDRFQASFDLNSGDCTLVRIETDRGETNLATRPTALKASGKYHVRFANVDERLTLWVNDDLPFDDGVPYDPAPRAGPTRKNDLDGPVGIGVHGGPSVRVSHLRLYRDTYYTVMGAAADVYLPAGAWSDPKEWGPLLDNKAFKTMYVHPGHYLVLGDNSPESSDSRYWGLVPERLIMGPVPLAYYPLSRARWFR
jgi:signal peptidase I